MEILIIESRPHKNGSSNLLANHFIRGAKESGHTVIIFDAVQADLHPCLGCEVCGMSGLCCQMVIDRFYSFNRKLSAKRLKTALIVAAWDSRDWTMQDISSEPGD